LQTLREYPAVRSTQDLDIFLSAEIIVDAEKTRALREALDTLGYRPIESARYYQIVRSLASLGRKGELKIDLLAQVPRAGIGLVKMDARRIRPRGYAQLHAHTTPEALTIDRYLLPIDIGEGGESVEVFIPHPFSFIMLKLFALRDRIRRDPHSEERRAPYHAFDIYSMVAMITAEEWKQGEQLRERYRDIDPLPEARSIVRELFADLYAPGTFLLREHAQTVGYLVPEQNVEDFISDVRDLILGTE
jgi:hypothetical protein